MTTLPRPRSFSLPRLPAPFIPATADSFAREESVTQGRFVPGGSPTAYFPPAGGEQVGAVLAHEWIHQNLFHNSRFGMFTILLSDAERQRPGCATQLRIMCHGEQWSVQEGDATHGELQWVAAYQPDRFAEVRRSLPSLILDQPPYREVYDAIAAVFPIDPALPPATLFGHWHLVHALACCSLDSNCLVYAAELDQWDQNTVIEYVLDHSPHNRFVSLVNELLRSGAMDQLLGTSIAVSNPQGPQHPGHPPAESFPTILRLVRSRVPAGFLDSAPLPTSVHAAATQLERLLGVHLPVKFQEPLPAFSLQQSPELVAQYPRELLVPRDSGALEQLFCTAAKAGHGVWLSIGIVKESEAWVGAKAYLLAEAGTPHPRVGGLRPGEPPPPPPFEQVIPMATLLRSLDRYPQFPHVVSFIRFSWKRWQAIPATAGRLTASVRVHLLTDLLEEELRLVMPDLGGSGRFFIIHDRPNTEEFSIPIFNPDVPGVYAIQRIMGYAVLGIFHKIAKTARLLPVDSETNVSSVHAGLLMMLSGRWR